MLKSLILISCSITLTKRNTTLKLTCPTGVLKLILGLTNIQKNLKIAIKESISVPKDVVNDLFQHVRGALEVKCTSDFPISHQQVKDLWRNKCPADDTIKLIETCKNEMLNIEKAFIRSIVTSPENVIFVTSNQQLRDLARFCTVPQKFCIIYWCWLCIWYWTMLRHTYNISAVPIFN